jgi:tetratricopeptide (TPR) repeat protein
MKVRSVTLAFVSSVFLAALGANSGSALATQTSSNPLAQQAYVALAGGDSERAVALYSQAIEARDLAPEFLANALLNRALAYQQMQKSSAAVDDYTAALSLDAMSASLRATALYNRALSQQKMGLLPLAIEDFTNSLLLNPQFAHAFLSRGNALRDSGQYLFALSDFERALKYGHPDPARVYYGEAQTFEFLRRPADAVRMYQAAVSANPDYAPAKQKLADLGNAPQVAVTESDPILTGAISAVGGTTLMRKPDLPKGVEPPQNLIAAVAQPGDATVVQVEEPIFSKTAKLYTDRVPEGEPSEVSIAPIAYAEPVKEKIIAIESVPDIPAPIKRVAAITKKSVPKAAPVVVPVADENTASISPVAAGWTVQIASADSEAAAWSTYKKMQKSHGVLNGKTPVVMKADLGTKGVFYRVRFAGFDDQKGALSECGKLKANGVSCYVSKATS